MSKLYVSKSFNALFGITLVSAAISLSACSGPSHPDVKARQDIMKSYGDAMGIMGDMVKAPDTFDAATLQEQASYLAKASKDPWIHFEDQEAVGNAKEAVWTDAADFKLKAENFQLASAELNKVAQTAANVDDFKPAFADVSKSCKSCHTEYQVDDD